MAKLVLYNENDTTTQIVSQNERENLLFKLPNTGGTLLTEESGGLSTLVHVDNPQMVPSDNEQRGSYMYVITQEDAKNLIITGVYKNGTSGLDSVPFYYNVNGNKLTIYSDTQHIARISYSTAIRAEAQPGTGGVLPNEDVTWTGNHTFRKPVKVADGSEPEHAVNLNIGDLRYARIIDRAIEYTVGRDGDFNSLRDAINKISTFVNSNRFQIVLKIKNGYTLNSYLDIVGLNNTVIIKGERSQADELILSNSGDVYETILIANNSHKVIFDSITIKAVGIWGILTDLGGKTEVRNSILKGDFWTVINNNNGGQTYIINSTISSSFSRDDKTTTLVTSHHGSTVKTDQRTILKYDGTKKCNAFGITSSGSVNNLWWAGPEDKIKVIGSFYNGVQLDSGGIFMNNGIDFSQATFSGAKFPQAANVWTSNGYISSN